MANSPVDRDKNYMKEVWGTTSLTSDYWSLPKKNDEETGDPVKIVQNVIISENCIKIFVMMKIMMIGIMEQNQFTDKGINKVRKL